jgi:hypothetical protein
MKASRCDVATLIFANARSALTSESRVAEPLCALRTTVVVATPTHASHRAMCRVPRE